MSRFSEMCEIIPGLLVGSVEDVEKMVLKGADVLVPLAFLDGTVWETPFRGEIIYCPVKDYGVLPDAVLGDLVDKICDRMDEGKKVAIFCAGGHGRTGYVAGCVLARRGIKDPIGFLRRNYSAKAIETEKQANAVFAYARGLRAKQINDGGLGEDFFEYRPYLGSGEYVYVSFSEWDHDLAAETVRILNELGFNVAYDRAVLQGKLWSVSKSNAIEDCSVFVSLRSPCEWSSHISYAEEMFADLMEKPMVIIDTDMKLRGEDSENFVYSEPSEADFGEKCLKALARKGIAPLEKKPDPSEDKPVRYVIGVKDRKERRWDLGITYYRDYGDDRRGYRVDKGINCNLRTRETWDERRNRIEKASDEEVYRAIGWKLIRFDLFTRSKEMDYFMSREDKEFAEKLVTLGGKPVPEIKAEYDKIRKRIDDYWRDYPYMDEFEYVDSKFDD